MRNAHLYGAQQAPVPFLEIPPYSGSAVLSLAHRPVGNRTGRLSTPRVRSHQLNHEGAKRRYFILAFLKTKAITCSKSELMKKSLCMHCKVVLAQLVSAALLCRWQTAGGGSIPAGPRVRIKTVDPPKGNGLGKKQISACTVRLFLHCLFRMLGRSCGIKWKVDNRPAKPESRSLPRSDWREPFHVVDVSKLSYTMFVNMDMPLSLWIQLQCSNK